MRQRLRWLPWHHSFQLVKSLLVFALLEEECSGHEGGAVAGVVAVFVGNLLVLCQSERVVALRECKVGLSDSFVGALYTGVAYCKRYIQVQLRQ